jgi:hypothetical protein
VVAAADLFAAAPPIVETVRAVCAAVSETGCKRERGAALPQEKHRLCRRGHWCQLLEVSCQRQLGAVRC